MLQKRPSRLRPVELTLHELAAELGGRLDEGVDGSQVIRGAAAVGEAHPGEVTFFANPRYLAALKASRATAVLVAPDFAEPLSAALLRVENPSAAFTKVVERFAPEPVKYPPGIHPTAVIGAGVELGEGVSVLPFAVLEDGVQVGARTVIGAHCFLGQGVRVGEECFLHPRVTLGSRTLLGRRVIVHSGAVLGSDGFGYEFSSGRHVKIPQVGIVQIDDEVEIGANVTIDRARFGRTWIQEGTKIDNLVQIGHNVVVGKHCVLVSQVGISGSCRLGQYVALGGQVGLAGHLEIGDRTSIGAQSGTNKSLPGGAVYMGSPAVPAAEWKEEVALIHRLSKLFARVKALERAQQNPESALESSSPKG